MNLPPQTPQTPQTEGTQRWRGRSADLSLWSLPLSLFSSLWLRWLCGKIVEMTETICQSCGARFARSYQLIEFDEFGEPGAEREFMLCVRCARSERKRLNAEPDLEDGLTRGELIAAL